MNICKRNTRAVTAAINFRSLFSIPRLSSLVAMTSTRLFLFFLYFLSICLSQSSAAAASSICSRLDGGFLGAIKSQCPIWIEPSFPEEEEGGTGMGGASLAREGKGLEGAQNARRLLARRGALEGVRKGYKVSGENFEKELVISQKGSYYSILFYASWCPFSSNFQPIFNSLNSMFPQIRHLTVEEASTMPSVFSRYGVHSFPAIVLANGNSMVQYHGSKDLSSLVNFYRETTGLNPIADFAVDELSSPRNAKSPWSHDQSLYEVAIKEPYVVLSILFILLKIMTSLFSVIFCYLKAFWASHGCILNLGIVSELSQLLERLLHTVDFKRIWSKLWLSNKTRNFQKGASNAHVWASSLASVTGSR